MPDIRVELTTNIFAKNPKAIKMKKINSNYKELINFAAAALKYNKKKIRLFVRKGSTTMTPGTEIKPNMDLDKLLTNGIMITVSKGEDYIGGTHKLNDKELHKYAKAPRYFYLKSIESEPISNMITFSSNLNPTEKLSNEICSQQLFQKTYPYLDGCVLPLLKKIAGKYENIIISYSKYGYYSFDYSNKIEYPPINNWESSVLRELRGLIVSSVTGKVLSRRFHKFFNIGEVPESSLDNINVENCLIYDKIDGSLVSPINLDSCSVIWATRRVDIEMEHKCITPDIIKLNNWCFNKNLTPLYEYCQKDRSVGIITYNESSLTLLAIRDNITGKYEDIEQICQDNNLDISIPFVYKDINLSNVNSWIFKEGVVISTSDHKKYKLKSNWYKCITQSNYFGGNNNFLAEYIQRYGDIKDCPKDYIFRHFLNNKIKNKMDVLKYLKSESDSYQNLYQFGTRIEHALEWLANKLYDWYNIIKCTITDSSNIDAIIDESGWPSKTFEKKDNDIYINMDIICNTLYGLTKINRTSYVENILDTFWINNKHFTDPIKTGITFNDELLNNDIKHHLVNEYLPNKITQLTGSKKVTINIKLTIPNKYKSDEGKIKGLWEKFTKYNIWDLRIDLQPNTRTIYDNHYGNEEFALLLVQYGLEDSNTVPRGTFAGVLVPVDVEYKLSEYQYAMNKALEYEGIVKMRHKFNMNHPFEIFCDLDGVLADFVKGVEELTHYLPKDQPINKLWQRILSKDTFFESLDWMPDGLKLWTSIKDIYGKSPSILTGLSMSCQNKVIKSKKKWCQSKLGDVNVITCQSFKKYEYSGKGKILIDDTLSHKKNWINSGGIFIHHTSYNDTIYQLKRVMDKVPSKFKLETKENYNNYIIQNPILCHQTLVDSRIYDYISHMKSVNLSDIYTIFEDNEPKIIGIDFEWNPYSTCRGVSLGQISTNTKVYLFDMELEKQFGFVKSLLQDKTILKIGFGLDDDINRLNYDVINVFDIQKHISENYEKVWSFKVPSLDLTCQLLIDQTINKNKKITMSQWNIRPLTTEQVDYGAKDALVLINIYNTLIEKYSVINKDLDFIDSKYIHMNSNNMYVKETNNVVFNFQHDLNKPMQVVYTGVFLSKESKQKIKDLGYCKHNRISCDHITLKYEPDKRYISSLKIGQHIEINCLGYYCDDKHESLLVKSIYGIGHITLSTINDVMTKNISDIPHNNYDKIKDDIKLVGVLGVEVMYINDQLTGLPQRVKDKIKNFENESLPGETLKFKSQELTSTHRLIIHRYAQNHFMRSESTGRNNDRKLTITMGRQKEIESKLKIIRNDKHNSYHKDNDIRFRLMDVRLVDKANIIYKPSQYYAEITSDDILLNEEINFDNTIVIIRGLSGSGKSTVSKIIKQKYGDELVGICSADLYFMRDDKYIFDINQLENAHKFCLRSVEMFLNSKHNTIIVDNTNSTLKEYQKYIDLAGKHKYKVLVLEIECSDKKQAIDMGKRSTHQIDTKVSINMYNRWEQDENAKIIKPYWHHESDPNLLQLSFIKWLTDNKLITSVKTKNKTHMWMKVNGMGVKFVNIPNDRLDEFYTVYLNSGISGSPTDEPKYLTELPGDKFRFYLDIDYEDELPFTQIEELVNVIKSVIKCEEIYVTGNDSILTDIIKTGLHVHCYDKIVDIKQCQELITDVIQALLTNNSLGHIKWDKFIDTQAYNCIRMLGSRKVTKEIDKGNVYKVLYQTNSDINGINLLKKVSCLL
jgi:predicted kinase